MSPWKSNPLHNVPRTLSPKRSPASPTSAAKSALTVYRSTSIRSGSGKLGATSVKTVPSAKGILPSSGRALAPSATRPEVLRSPSPERRVIGSPSPLPAGSGKPSAMPFSVLRQSSRHFIIKYIEIVCFHPDSAEIKRYYKMPEDCIYSQQNLLAYARFARARGPLAKIVNDLGWVSAFRTDTGEQIYVDPEKLAEYFDREEGEVIPDPSCCGIW